MIPQFTTRTNPRRRVISNANGAIAITQNGQPNKVPHATEITATEKFPENQHPNATKKQYIVKVLGKNASFNQKKNQNQNQTATPI